MTLISHDFCPFQASGRKKFVKKILFTRSNLNQRFCNQGPQGFNLAEFEARSFFDYFHVQLIFTRNRSLKNLSSPNIDWCTLYAANCVQSRCFVLLLCLFVCVFVYLLQLKYFFFVCFCVHLFIYNNFENVFKNLLLTKSRTNQLKLQRKDRKNTKCHYISVANFILKFRSY